MVQTILNISQNHYIRGGSDRYYFALEELFVERGHQVIPFTATHTRNKKSKWSDYFPPGVDFIHPGPRDIIRFIYSRPAAKAMERLLRNIRIDIAHIHIYYGQLTSSILKPLKDAGIPVVQTLHEYKLICPVYTLVSNGTVCEGCKGGGYKRAIFKRCNKKSLSRTLLSVAEAYLSRVLGSVDKIDHFIAVSNFILQKMTQFGIPAEKVSTVHNFLDASNIQPNCSPGRYYLYFGRLEQIKGIFTLLDAATSVREVPLYIVGDGDAYSEIELKIKEKGLHHVHLTGFKQGEELSDLIRNSICTIVPSEWYEPFGLTILESFAHGRPVIATGIGGIPESISDGVDGFLVSPGSVKELRDRMIWMAEHREEAVKMGLAGREKVETQFNSEIHYDKIMDVYRKVL